MSEPLDVDPNALRASLPELRWLADEAASALTELTGAVDREGACWGNDAGGKAFAKNYLPDVEQGIRNLTGLVSGMRALGSEVSNVANEFDNQDSDSAALLQNSEAATAVDIAPDVSRATPNGLARTPNGLSGTPNGVLPTSFASRSEPAARSLRQPASLSEQGGSGQAGVPHLSSASNSPETTSSPGAVSLPSAVAGPDLPAPVPSHGAATSADFPGALDAGRSGDSRSMGPAEVDAKTGYSPADSANGEVDRQSGVPAASPWMPAERSCTPSPPTSARPGVAAPEGTPWSRSSVDTPWSKPGPASDAPAGNRPPRISAPKDTPPRARPPVKSVPPRRRAKALGRPTPIVGAEAEALGIVRELAARHRLELSGFEASGMDEPAAVELASAVDSLLARYLVSLDGIEIRVPQPATSGAREPRPWIILDQATISCRRLGATAVPDRTAAALDRPIQTAVVLEFARILDLAGAGRARRTAQRTLIAEYLRISGARSTDHMATVVTGYRRWRGQLGASSTGFDPMSALAASFAAAELDEAPSRAAKVLHRLLVESAAASEPSRSP
ncbi:hypothetical protein [Nocardia sp. NBC_01388]|uniref:hypothetical protein n=1 Tax=Nocardia sp. NBC_01388 TaxID=2903596 RepID=UPI003253F000